MEKVKYEDGIYEDISFEEYTRIDAYNNSMLKEFMSESPFHFKYKVDNDLLYKDSKALDFGKKIHMRVLEPEIFERKYVSSPTTWKQYEKFLTEKARKDLEEKPHYLYRANTTAYKEIMAIFKGQMDNELGKGNYEIIDNKEWVQLEQIKENVYNNQRLVKILVDAKKELTGIWTDPETGLQLKCRFDSKPNIDGYFADLKSSASANPDKFWRDFHSYGYDMQMAMYSDAYRILFEEELKAVIIIAAEKEEPYYIQPFYIKSDSRWFDLGRVYYRRALEKLHYCVQADDWSGYHDPKNNSTEMYELGEPPHYLMRELEENEY